MYDMGVYVCILSVFMWVCWLCVYRMYVCVWMCVPDVSFNPPFIFISSLSHPRYHCHTSSYTSSHPLLCIITTQILGATLLSHTSLTHLPLIHTSLIYPLTSPHRYWEQHSVSMLDEDLNAILRLRVQHHFAKPLQPNMSVSEFWRYAAKHPNKSIRDYNEKFEHNMPLPGKPLTYLVPNPTSQYQLTFSSPTYPLYTPSQQTTNTPSHHQHTLSTHPHNTPPFSGTQRQTTRAIHRYT